MNIKELLTRYVNLVKWDIAKLVDVAEKAAEIQLSELETRKANILIKQQKIRDITTTQTALFLPQESDSNLGIMPTQSFDSTTTNGNISSGVGTGFGSQITQGLSSGTGFYTKCKCNATRAYKRLF